MKTPGDGSSTSSAGKKRHKRRPHATSEGSSGPNECSGDDKCELCSSHLPTTRGSSGEKKKTHSTPHLRGHGATFDPSIVTAFYCKTARLYGLLHQKLQSASGAEFTEDGILLLGNQMTDIVAEALSITQSANGNSTYGGPSGSGNPFVMLLSMILPPLRKFLSWTWTTRGVWYSAAAPSLTYQQKHAVVVTPVADNTARSNTSTGSNRIVVSNTVLWSMLAQHDAITSLTTLFTGISRLTEQSEDEMATSELSSSLSASQSSSTPSLEPPGSLGLRRISQVHHIVLEFEDTFSEYRVCLAELTECLVENMQTIASRLCRPVLTKDTSKARGSVNEFVELLVLQILDPVAKRFIDSPSPSRLYLFPHLLDKCISVVIDEFILRQSARMNEIEAAQIDKAAMYLRTWSLRVETNYNARARAVESPSHAHTPANGASSPRRPSLLVRSGSDDVKAQFRSITESPNELDRPASSAGGLTLYRANTSQDDFRGRMDARLELTTLDGFKRLDNHIKPWLHAGKGDAATTLPPVRSRAEGLRESLVRTFTARNSGGSVRFEK